MTPVDIPDSLFADHRHAAHTLHKLHELFITSGTTHTAEDFSRALVTALRRCPDPDLGITNLLRFLEATVSKSTLLNDLVQHPVLMEVLMKVLSSSVFFADILVRDPELFRWLTASEALVRPRRKDFLAEEVGRAIKLFQKSERKLDGLRRLFRREILRIGARDILGEATLPVLTEELSHLADVLVDASCMIARQQLSDRYPNPPETPFAVIGLGKLGGAELNYSSDIDIMFAYRDEGEITDAGGKQRTHHEYFNSLAEKVVQNLSQTTVEGHLYRVDTRLRPESGAGPLARSAQSFLLYYESRGELWERQMLIKARAIAGNVGFGEEFLSQLEPFVYPRTFFENPRNYIARIKGRIEAEIAGEENVKLQAGGIRDIEFIVQALQLVNGGKWKEVRTRTTLDAIERLAKAKFLSEREQRTLSEAYTFFRTVEHRLQTMLNTQTHELPSDEHSVSVLAKKLDLSSAAKFREKSDAFRRNVRSIFEDVLLVDASNENVTLGAIVDGNVDSGVIELVLERFGFSEKKKAAKNLAALISGSSLFHTKELDIRARDAFREIADALFSEIAKTPNPDMTLHNLTIVARAQPFPEQLYKQLDEPNFRKLLLTVCATSPRFAKGLAGNPLLLESLATDPDLLSGEKRIASATNVVALKNNESLRAGIRYVLGVSSFDELTADLSSVADTVVSIVTAEVCKKKKVPLAIFGLGKYGTREITFDADLDLIFIGNADSAAVSHQLERISTSIVRELSTVSSEGKLYDVDARLRPEGKNAPLVVNQKAYLAYLSNRASLWERQSLTRLRFVAGDARLGSQVLKEVEEFVYESPLPAGWVESIVSMRRKIETRSRVSGTELLDVKLGEGGMVDIEFLAQMLQLQFGSRDPAFRKLQAAEVLRVAAKVLDLPVAGLVRAYELFRKIETFLRISLEERGTILPEREKLDLFAKNFGKSGSALHDEVSSTMRFVRQTFLQTASRISHA